MKKRLLALLLALCMLASLLPTAALAAGQNRFNDVKDNDWFYDPVQFMYSNGYMSGTGANTFSPGTTTTRGMMVTVLYRLDGEPADIGDKSFSDVTSGFFVDAVIWAASNLIVVGYEDGRFLPNNSITREQMALILYQYAKHKGYDTSASANLDVFPDGHKTSSWAREALAWANAEGIINGSKEGGRTLLNPSGWATRAQLATVFFTFVQKVIQNTCYVNFMLNAPDDGTPSGGIWEQQRVAKGDTCARPSRDPAFEGYVFKGWYSIDGQPFDFTTPITGDTTVEARWEKADPDSYMVTFDLNYEGAGNPYLAMVQPGEPVTAPAQPSREGYKFLGWFTKAQGGEQYVFDKAVHGNLTLYAQWAETVTHTVSFDLNYPGAGVYKTLEVAEGQTCAVPNEPGRKDYIFAGWYSGKDGGEKFDFSTPITGDTALFAHWVYDGVNYANPYQQTTDSRCPVTLYTNDPLKTFSMMGKPYAQGITFTANSWGAASEAAYSLEGQYELMTFKLGSLDNRGTAGSTLYIYADGELVDTIKLAWNMPTYFYSLNVKGVTQLRFYRETNGYTYGYGMADTILYTAEDVAAEGLTVPDSHSAVYWEDTNLSTQEQALPYQYTTDSRCPVTLYDGDPLKGFAMMGNLYTQGITFTASSWSAGSEAAFNLGGEFEQFSAVIGHIDNRGGAGSTLHVYADGQLVESLELTETMSCVAYCLNVRGVNQLLFVRETNGYTYGYGMADITLSASPLDTQPLESAKTAVLRSNLEGTAQILPYQYTTDSRCPVTLYTGDPNKSFTMMGRAYTEGFTFTANSWGADSQWQFNLGGAYTRMTFTVGHLDNSGDTNNTLYIYGDKDSEGNPVLLQTVELAFNGANQEITLDVSGVNNLRMSQTPHGYRYGYGIANIALQ